LVNRETAMGYLNGLPRVFVFDGFSNWDPDSRIKVGRAPRRAVGQGGEAGAGRRGWWLALPN
jgi:hypothetical protein